MLKVWKSYVDTDPKRDIKQSSSVRCFRVSSRLCQIKSVVFGRNEISIENGSEFAALVEAIVVDIE